MINKSPVPKNEVDRLNTLENYSVLDTLPEEEYDELTKLASYIAKTPIALISLIDNDRQWFKSKVGLDADETPRDISFCQYAIMNDEVYEVPNAIENPIFKDNPLVTGAPDIRRYHGFPLKAPDGNNIGTLCVIGTEPGILDAEQKLALRTIANQVITNLEIRKKNHILKLTNIQKNNFFNLSIDLICIASTDGFFEMVNPAFSKSLGYSEEELLDQPFINFISPEDHEKTKTEINKLSKGIEAIDFMTRFISKTGKSVFLSWRARADLSSGKLYAVARDLTKQIEKDRIFKLELSAIDSSVMRIEISADRKIMKANSNFLQLSKYDLEELEGKPHSILSFDEDISMQHSDKIWISILNGTPRKGEFRRRDKNGQEFWIQGAYIPISNTRGIVQKVIKIAYDITEKVLQQKEIIKLAQIKEDFLANMSHEIRTPMNAINGFSDLLSTTNLSEEQLKYVEVLKIASKSLSSLVNNILDVSKIESGGLKLETHPISLTEIVEEVIALESSKAQEKELRLTTTYRNIPPVVLGDRTRVMQAILNLVSNAIKFTNNGEVNISIDEEFRGNGVSQIAISVEDSGIGIKAEKLDTIFERFTQAESSTTRLYGGTGLGLNIVKKIVDLMKGSTHVTSEFNNGSKFSLKIPFSLPSDFESSKKVSSPELNKTALPLSNVSILVVEDNELNQMLIETILNKNGASIDIACNGEEALEKFNNNNYHLIIMDLQMPIMNGYEATEHIRNILKSEIPIIACSAQPIEKEKSTCIEKGMNDYLAKPYTDKQLLEIIKPFVQKNQKVNETKTSANEIKITDDFKTIFKEMKIEFGIEYHNHMKAISNRIVNEDIGKLENAITSNDSFTIRKIAHRLIGSFVALDCKQGAKIAKKTELSIDENKLKDTLHNSNQMLFYLKNYKHFFEND